MHEFKVGQVLKFTTHHIARRYIGAECEVTQVYVRGGDISVQLKVLRPVHDKLPAGYIINTTAGWLNEFDGTRFTVLPKVPPLTTRQEADAWLEAQQ